MIGQTGDEGALFVAIQQNAEGAPMTPSFAEDRVPTRIATVKMGATKRLPPAVRAWFNVAPVSMEFTYC